MATFRLNATAASLLGFLHERPMAGWDLVNTAQRRIGNFWSLTPSQVYRELAAMADASLIEAGARGKRDRQPYALTAAGRAAFQEWIRQEPGRKTIRFPLLLTLAFGDHLPPDRLASILDHHREQHAAQLRHYERQRAERPPSYWEARPAMTATLDFGIQYERAVLKWFDELPPTLRGGAALETSGGRQAAPVLPTTAKT